MSGVCVSMCVCVCECARVLLSQAHREPGSPLSVLWCVFHVGPCIEPGSAGARARAAPIPAPTRALGNLRPFWTGGHPSWDLSLRSVRWGRHFPPLPTGLPVWSREGARPRQLEPVPPLQSTRVSRLLPGLLSCGVSLWPFAHGLPLHPHAHLRGGRCLPLAVREQF